jgi:hypothetical protein
VKVFEGFGELFSKSSPKKLSKKKGGESDAA